MTMIEIYDTLLRDGTQSAEIALTVEDKLRIFQRLAELGIHYVEGGWPGSNPRDVEFFKRAKTLKVAGTKLAAFGSTRHKKNSPANDPNLQALVAAETPVVTIFGKAWGLHTQEALDISLEQNLDLIESSVTYLKKHVEQVFFDAEHFFDGYKEDPDFALRSLQAAEKGGADVLVLCDTNGGSLPDEIQDAIKAVKGKVSAPLGIHCHNDGELAVANSLAAVRAGVTQIQGTVNGYGERTGNANLTSILPNLILKLGLKSISLEQLKKLHSVSRFVDEICNRPPDHRLPFVGDSAFAHKGGVHTSAVAKNPKTYEHIDPASIGNKRRVLISDLAGRASILLKGRELGIDLKDKDPLIQKIVDKVKELENQGLQFEGAEASLEILIKKAMGKHQNFFRLVGFRVIDEKHPHAEKPYSEATIQVEVDGKLEHTASEGEGPVSALDNALRKALERFYPQLKKVRLIDYKVRVLPAGKGTASQVRVLIESSDGEDSWGTVGVSHDIIQASWNALVDSIDYKLMKSKPFLKGGDNP